MELSPATYQSLIVDNDYTPFTQIGLEGEAILHDVLVDGISGQAGIGSFGSFSERIKIILEEAHPELNTEFQTKYFIFTAPGKVEWGHHGQSFEILKAKEKSFME